MVKAVLVGVVGMAVLGLGASFQEVPPPIGAYTLRGGEWQIGAGFGFSLAAPGLLTTLNIAYGITSSFQAGFGISASRASHLDSTYMTYEGQAKWRFALWSGLDLAFPAGFSFVEMGFGMQFNSLSLGIVASGRVGANLVLHAGMTVGLARTGTFCIPPYFLVDFDLAPNLKVVGEFTMVPLDVVLSAWLRVFSFLDLKVELAPRSLWFQGEVYLRF